MPNIPLTPEQRALGFAILLAGGAGAAEMPPPGPVFGPPPPPAAQAFGDWRLDCGAAACVVRTEVAGADGAVLVALEAGPEALVLRTALPLLLPEGLGITLGEADGEAGAEHDAVWRTCDASGCEARLALTPDLLDGLRRERAGRLRFTLVTGERVRVSVSLMGFTAAWRARRAVGR